MIERKNPIPAGVYWVDIDDVLDPENLAKFNRWAMDEAPKVKMLKKETTMTQAFPASRQTWVLFRLTAPTKRWPESLKIGLPTRAAKGAKTKRSDTQKRPKKKSVSEYWADEAGDALKSPWGSAVLALGLLWALSSRR